MKQKRDIAFSIAGIVMTVLICAAVIGLIRNLGYFISLLGPLFDLKAADIKQFSAIFGQLSTARIDPPIALTIIFGFSFWWLLLSIRRPRNAVARWVLICLLATVLFLIAVITVLLFTEVNSIRFYDVLQSLLQVLSAGGF